MKKMLRYTAVLASLVLFSASAALFAAEERYGIGGGAEPKELSEATRTLKGTLAEEQGLWKLDTGKEVYYLNFGDRAYLAGTGMPLEKGKTITVEGGVFDRDIVVFSVSLEGKTYAFRDKSGVPLWARQGWGRGPGGAYMGRGGRGPYNDYMGRGRQGPYDDYMGWGRRGPGDDDRGWGPRGGRGCWGGHGRWDGRGGWWRDRGDGGYR